MLIQKVFHVRRPLDETRERLSNSRNLSGRFWSLGGLARLENSGGGWDVMSLLGFRGPLELELLPTEDRHQVLFRSTDGGMELCGLMELLPVRDHLTEVQLTLEYEIQSPLRRALDRVLGVIDRRVDRQIADMKARVDGLDRAGVATRSTRPELIPSPV